MLLIEHVPETIKEVCMSYLHITFYRTNIQQSCTYVVTKINENYTIKFRYYIPTSV